MISAPVKGSLGEVEARAAASAEDEAEVQRWNDRRAALGDAIGDARLIRTPSGLEHDRIIGIQREAGAADSSGKWRARREIHAQKTDSIELIPAVARSEIDVDSLRGGHLENAVHPIECARVPETFNRGPTVRDGVPEVMDHRVVNRFVERSAVGGNHQRDVGTWHQAPWRAPIRRLGWFQDPNCALGLSGCSQAPGPSPRRNSAR